MINQYKVTVNGKEFEIGVEAVGTCSSFAGSAFSARSAAPAADPVPVPVSAPAPSPASPVTSAAAPAASPAPVSGGERITAPMPGNILSVNVAAGQAVKKGDVLMILEAMKMENEIISPCDGTISSVNTTKGVVVESGTLLCVIQ